MSLRRNDPSQSPKERKGLVLGKFMPPHDGHLHLIDFASRYVDELVIVVGTLANEPIPGGLRHQWMRELAPFANVLHLEDELPQDPSEHPDFWSLWQTSLLRILKKEERPDVVFASEPYGAKLASVLDAKFIPVDLARRAVPISATAIRTDPMTHWDRIPRCVRPYFVKRVCIFGPESTGKSTLTNELAKAFDTVAVPEYARTLLETLPPPDNNNSNIANGSPVDAEMMEIIARGQLASEEALARSANRLLFCDTDILATTIWSDVLVGSGSARAWVKEEARQRRYDLTLLTDIDIPWVAEPGIRFRPDDRAAFLALCENALSDVGRSYVRISGSREQRLATARKAVEALLVKLPSSSSSV